VHPRIDTDPHGLHLLGNIKPLSVYHYAFDLAADAPEEEEMKSLLLAAFDKAYLIF
jgi:hypothetical protein